MPWRRQAMGWALAYAGFAALSVAAALRVARARETGAPSAVPPADGAEAAAPPHWVDRSLWIVLAACASLLLLAVTLHITQHVPAPLLWVVPLAAYLLSFVLCFEWPRLYWRPIWLVLLPAALVGMAYLMKEEIDAAGFVRRGALFVGALFVCCMVCHGEIVRRRPGARYLTTYYLLIALGGALGGLFAGVVAPLAFIRLVELPVGLLLTGVLWVLVSLLVLWPRLGPMASRRPSPCCPSLLGIYVTYVVEAAAGRDPRVPDHGPELLRSARGAGRGASGGRGRLPDAHPRRHHPRHAVARTSRGGGCRRPTTATTPGWGARWPSCRPIARGGSAWWGSGRARWRPTGVRATCSGSTRSTPRCSGWPRRSSRSCRTRGPRSRSSSATRGSGMEGEPPQELDLLAVDAFSGDAVPGHLLTQEALELYTRHLAPDGILALHVSNRFVDFDPVLAAGAHALRRPVVNVTVEGDSDRLCYYSQWILIPPRDGRRRYPALWQYGTKVELRPGFRPWTDELWSLYPVLRKDIR